MDVFVHQYGWLSITLVELLVFEGSWQTWWAPRWVLSTTFLTQLPPASGSMDCFRLLQSGKITQEGAVFLTLSLSTLGSVILPSRVYMCVCMNMCACVHLCEQIHAVYKWDCVWVCVYMYEQTWVPVHISVLVCEAYVSVWVPMRMWKYENLWLCNCVSVMCVPLSMCVCIFVCVWLNVFKCRRVSTYVQIWVHVSVRMCKYTRMSVSVLVCVPVPMCKCECTSVSVWNCAWVTEWVCRMRKSESSLRVLLPQPCAHALGLSFPSFGQ